MRQDAAGHNLYEILGISPGAEPEEIAAACDRAYEVNRRLVTHHKPEVAASASDLLRTLDQARTTLLGPTKCAAYDAVVGLGGTDGLADPSQLASSMPITPPAPLSPLGAPAVPTHGPGSHSVLVDAWVCPEDAMPNPGTRSCEGCGNPLGRDCPACGRLIRAAARFCPECGASAVQSDDIGIAAESDDLEAAESWDRPGTEIEWVRSRIRRAGAYDAVHVVLIEAPVDEILEEVIAVLETDGLKLGERIHFRIHTDPENCHVSATAGPYDEIRVEMAAYARDAVQQLVMIRAWNEELDEALLPSALPGEVAEALLDDLDANFVIEEYPLDEDEETDRVDRRPLSDG